MVLFFGLIAKGVWGNGSDISFSGLIALDLGETCFILYFRRLVALEEEKKKFLASLRKRKKKKIFGVLITQNPAAVFRRSMEFAPSDHHDFWTEASLNIKEGFHRWDLDFEAWEICFLPGQIGASDFGFRRARPHKILLAKVLKQIILANVESNVVNSVTMPRKSSEDYKNTRHYIPKISHEFRSPIKEKLRNLEERYIHEGRVVFDNFTDLNYVRSLFHFVEFECLLEINEQVCPRFILEFYSQYRLSYSDEGQMFVEFVFQNQYFSLSLEDFAQILRIPCEGACVFSDRWSLDELVYGAPSEGPYQTNLPSPDDIISYVREDREGQVTRIRHQEEIEVQDNSKKFSDS
ncbi:hypothetical protein Tco_0699560 [Tanacetum coccineum]